MRRRASFSSPNPAAKIRLGKDTVTIYLYKNDNQFKFKAKLEKNSMQKVNNRFKDKFWNQSDKYYETAVWFRCVAGTAGNMRAIN